jgi:tRNA A-37 threonylcarbamoyl transferase component Bud32
MNVLGRYQIIDQIGTGSMGTVYRARDTVLDREVAIKTIRTSGEVDPEIRERFYREARACARLQHPGIVAVYDLAEADHVAYIAMELLHGSDLRKLIEQRAKIPLAAKLEGMIQVCEALDHAHRHGVIHRDVKPSNLFLQEDGRAKIMDFGIARLPSSRLTVAGNILGTPNYMSPEQILGKTADARADLFSAALVFFEFLTFTHPFHATVIPHRIVEGQPDSLFDHDPNLPPLLEKVLDRALLKDPEKRYGTGNEFAGDLRAVLDAVKLNSSPTMSKVELPSERALPKPQPVVEGDMTLLKPAPEGEDPAEWRLSEVLRLIPAFEEAVEAKDKGAAEQALRELKAIGVADKRFAEPAESCQANYDRAFGQGTGPQKPPAPSTAPVTAQPATPEPLAAAVAAAPAPAKPTTTVATPAAVLRPKVGKDQLKALIAAGVVVFVIVAIVSIVSVFSRPVPLQPAEGTAKVAASTTSVRKSPEANADLVAQVNRGEVLRLLDLPRDRNTAWIRVQPVVNGKNLTPGYVQIGDLQDWSEWSLDKPTQLAVVARAMSPDNNAPDDAIRSQIAKVKNLEEKFADDPSEAPLKQEAQRLEAILAARQKALQSDEIPAVEPTKPVAPAPVAAAAVPPQAGQPAAVPDTPEKMLARARRLKDTHELAKAKSLVRQVLRSDPTNAAAKTLLAQIEQLEKLDELTR